jgi:hypothetical protein
MNNQTKDNEIERLRQGDIDSLTKKERNLLTNVKSAGKIVLKEDEKLFKELGKEDLKKEPILMIEGIDIKELGEVFAGYYFNNSEQVTKIINLYRNQALLTQKQNILELCENAKKKCEEEYGKEESKRFKGIITEEIIGELK